MDEERADEERTPPGNVEPPATEPRDAMQLAGPEGEALAREAAEIRRLIDAGASSPEELRALAERLRSHREREEALWRAQVKPTLKKIRRGAPPPPPPAMPTAQLGLPPLEVPAPAEPGSAADAGPSSPIVDEPGVSRVLLAAGIAAAVLLVVMLAVSSTVLWIAVPVAGLLGYAWWQGRQAT